MRAADDAEIHRAPAVHAVFEEQVGMLLSQLIVHRVITPSRMIGDVRRRRSVAVVGAIALVNDHDLVVFEQIEFVGGHDAPQFVEAPGAGRFVAQTDCGTGEIGWLPSRRVIVRKPVALLWVCHRQRFHAARLRPALRPTNPEPEQHPLAMGVITHRRQAVGKLLRVRMPVAHGAKPAGVDVKQLDSQHR